MKLRIPCWLALLGIAASAAATLAADKGRVVHDHRFRDPEHWAKAWDDPSRIEWQRPGFVIELLGIRRGSKVADLGAGTGFFTAILSHAVEEEGRVYAVDIEPEMLAHIDKRPDLIPGNVETILAAPDDPKLPAGAIDVVLVVNTWHHIPRRVKYLSKLKPALAKGGRVAIVDWQKRELPIGPRTEEKLSRDEVVAEFEKARWTLTSESVALPYQYLLVFKP